MTRGSDDVAQTIRDSFVMHVAEMCDRTRTSSGRDW